VTLNEAYEWLELASEFAGEGATLDDERQAKVNEAHRVVCIATGAPWWEYEGIGPEEGAER
jgi:hypothetical protein